MTKCFDKFMVCLMTGTWLTVLQDLFGVYDKSFGFLLLVMVLDFITGLGVAWKEKKVSSTICINGLFKKLFVLVYVIIAYHLDVLLGVDYIRTAVCYLYATGEVISIIENGSNLGVPIPKPIVKVLEKLNGGEDDD